MRGLLFAMICRVRAAFIICHSFSDSVYQFVVCLGVLYPYCTLMKDIVINSLSQNNTVYRTCETILEWPTMYGGVSKLLEEMSLIVERVVDGDFCDKKIGRLINDSGRFTLMMKLVSKRHLETKDVWGIGCARNQVPLVVSGMKVKLNVSD